jgi:dinuclear metal center YbgI/SA1388 family protein
MISRTVADVLTVLEEIAPAHLALERDPTGLLVGDPGATVTRLVAALDVTEHVVEQAKAVGAQMIIAHHPLIYHPLRTLRLDGGFPQPVVIACLRAGIAVACAHTCWDIAEGGVNDVLAGLLGLQNVRPLRITYREPLVKIVVFVPVAYRVAVLNAMASFGAGAIGDYDRCAFWTPGTGTFRAQPGADPFIGNVGVPEYVSEERLEMIAPEKRFRRIIAAMKATHPYEEVAYEVYPLKNTGREYGLGRIGTLVEPLPGTMFIQQVGAALNMAVRFMTVAADVYTVAVCGGAGAELMPDAIAAGADALVTSDVRHHEFIDAVEKNFCLMDAGHAATETPGARELGNRLTAATGLPVMFA